ncbi:MAG: hypothetical protein KF862_27130, partial [Chitinophagaceae bacterium]|nr:hypothetical protein [Chitinophagaceae bacterium]
MSYGQQTINTNGNKSFVNINFPKSPESTGFEKFGNYNINELTGLPDISIPIHTVNSRFLTAPITLSYHASGIKVSQEATWVGLGFDLMVAGRITAEVKGCPDYYIPSYGVSQFKNGWSRLMNRIGNVLTQSNQVYTYASTFDGAGDQFTNPQYDNNYFIADAAWYGMAEPDIYYANFMGFSLTFYYDKYTDSLSFIGENSLFAITSTKDSFGRITAWYLTDNNGVKYFFEQREITRISPQNQNAYTMYPFTVGDANSSWLLTKILHPSGDYINFQYTNYGTILPAFDYQTSIECTDGVVTSTPNYISSLQPQCEILPAYLTQVETINELLQFNLGNRVDIGGTGAKKLESIIVTDKITGSVRKKILFGYDYFVANTVEPNSPVSSINATIPATYRLKLNTVTFNDSTIQPPYKFFYYSNNGIIPNKYSVARDYWGMYNGNTTNLNFIPTLSSAIADGLIDANLTAYSNTANASSFTGNAIRSCQPLLTPTLTMDSIVYPTGGSTKLIYQPHVSLYRNKILTGGGLRIESIKNYSATGNRTNETDYSYTTGIYLGTLNFFTNTFRAAMVPQGQPSCTSASFHKMSGLSSLGAANNYDYLIGYSSVTANKVDANNIAANGSVTKIYDFPSVQDLGPSSLSSLFLMPSVIVSSSGGSGLPSDMRSVSFSQFTPSVRAQIDGKLQKEIYYDNIGNIIKQIEYYYTQKGYARKPYSVRAEDMLSGGIQAGINANVGSALAISCYGIGIRRYSLWIYVAKSYYTVIDSVIEKTFTGATPIVGKKLNTYDNYYQLKTEQALNSDGTYTTAVYTHPYDYSVSPYTAMIGAHIYSPIVSTTISRNNNLVTIATNNYYNPSAGVYVPQNAQIQIGTNPPEIRERYTAYDSYGHLLEKQKADG